MSISRSRLEAFADGGIGGYNGSRYAVQKPVFTTISTYNPMQTYIRTEDVERILFNIIQESLANDIKKYMKPMFALEQREYKAGFMKTNFHPETLASITARENEENRT